MSIFKFKYFDIIQEKSAMKVGTDSMIFGALLDVSKANSALDIGTGTGILALMQAQKNPRLKITAIEIEKYSFQEAKENIENSNYSEQVQLIHGDFLNYDFHSTFDLIFSNPPYFENSLQSENSLKNLARHTSSLNLNELFQKAKSLLSEKGSFCFILPQDKNEQIRDLLKNNNLFINKLVTIFSKENVSVRTVFFCSKEESEISFESLIIRNSDNSYTKKYIELTKDFHAINLSKN